MLALVRLFVVSLILTAVIIGSAFGWSARVDLPIGISIFVSIYGVVAVLRKAIQIVRARRHNRRMQLAIRTPIVEAAVLVYPEDTKKIRAMLHTRALFDAWRVQFMEMLDIGEAEWAELIAKSWNDMENPTVGLVVPIYKTRQEELRALVASLAHQTYRPRLVYLILNDPTDQGMQELIPQLITEFAWSGIEFVFDIEEEKGKRNAMKRGFDACISAKVDVTYNIDSDSEPDRDAISNAARAFVLFPVHCLTGDIRVSNEGANLLTMLTGQRYFIAFQVERAAQEFAMTCLSGPFLAVRTVTLARIVQAWHTQHFLGNLCNFGDDRHIATLILALFGNGSSTFLCDSISYTDCPEQFSTWIVQQTRWARSFWRETIISLPWAAGRYSLWTLFDVVYQTLFPFILLSIIAFLVLRTIAVIATVGVGAAATFLLVYAAIVLFLVFVFHGVYGAMTKRDVRFLMNPIYLAHHFGVLLWVRFYAGLTLNVNEWGTK